MDYTLLDSGDGQKLESFGRVTLIRPSSIAVWPKTVPKLWSQTAAQYVREGNSGFWQLFTEIPPEWIISISNVHCLLKMTSFGHLGIFPEHTKFWPTLQRAIEQCAQCRVLNLFAYTGVSSIFAAQCGARVTHVDASKAAVRWAEKNVEISGLSEKRIFWVIEDVITFLKKEIRRKKSYDIILLDPPTYGRGSEGEIFKIDRDFFFLLFLCSQLLADSSTYVLITSHTPGHTPEFLRSLARRSIRRVSPEKWSCGENFCGEGEKALPSGSFVAWSL
ncbi:class I SAM-dependent methyltransferase [Candidatus Chlamydia sanziniae]|nr:class I SAM-dependent methyltransferase [Candidatus Chlamydia sanziniae]